MVASPSSYLPRKLAAKTLLVALLSAAVVPLLTQGTVFAAADPISSAPSSLRADAGTTAGTIVLSWSAPSGGPESPLGYRVYAIRNGVAGAATDVTTLSYTDTVGDSVGVFSYRVTAIYDNSVESLPATTIVTTPYPPCTWFVYSTSPPDVIVRPECLKP